MLISIITATYNSASTILRCLESVNSQTWADIEHIIIDGASTDDTVEKIKSVPNRVTRLVSEPDNGIYEALNKGLGMAKGEVIGFLHADDVFASPETIGIIAGTFSLPDNPNNKMTGVYGNLLFLGNKNQDKVVRSWMSKPFCRSDLKYGWMPPHPTLFLYREVYRKHGLFDASFAIAGDYDFMLRIMNDEEVKLIHIPQIITLMSHGGMSTGRFKNLIIKSKEDLRALRKNGYRFPGLVLATKNLRKLPQIFIHKLPQILHK